MHLKHLEHIEDLLLVDPDLAVTVFNDFLNQMSGSNLGLNITLKIDGSPSVVVGLDQQGYFTSSKSYWNLVPKAYRSKADAELFTPGIREPLELLLQKIKTAEIQDVRQGDLLFINLSANGYFEFTPNTLTYRVHKESKYYNEIQENQIGCSWHTLYVDDKATPNQFKDQTGITNLDPYFETKQWVHKIKDLSVPKVKIPHEFHLYIKKYQNYLVRNSISRASDETYKLFIEQEYIMESSKLKTDKGKANLKDKLERQLEVPIEVHSMYNMFYDKKDEFFLGVEKEIIPHVEVLSLGVPSEHEGFVVSHGVPVKIINRPMFSALNFKQDYS